MTKIRVDTGGTFTDCWGCGEHISEQPRLVKVLSSGRLRISVVECLSPTSFKIVIPEAWNTSEDFFVGFQIIECGEVVADVVTYDSEHSIITSSAPLEQRSVVELSAGEEAPIMGSRLLCGTALGENFPKMDFRLATTRGTNALLEKKGSPVVLFITQGFGDLLQIGDQRRADLFALDHQQRKTLYSEVVEVTERVDALGQVLIPLQAGEGGWRQQAQDLIGRGARVAAVALLHSYRNPVHEEWLRDQLLALGFDHVSLSSELAPLIKILPRAETAVVNAYLQPVMQGFLDRIQSALGQATDFTTMTSAGGLESLGDYCPKDALLSGPAGGVSGAAAIADELGVSKILTFDMGGTSTDVARYDGGFLYQFEQQVGDAHLMSPALKIETVAAGGGSICYWSQGGLRVGPESAGANPGPACYGAGGPLTITDVNLLLGRIDPDNFAVPLGEEEIAAALRAALILQQQAGLSDNELDGFFLEGLLEIAVEQMADAIRTISIRDGADPADYALLAFGGAGPLHACDIAQQLGMREIIIPAEAGLLSAYGLDQAEVERFAEKQLNWVLGESNEELERMIEQLRGTALSGLASAGHQGTIRRCMAELRWVGQDATLSIDLVPGESLAETFRQSYQKVFGYLPSQNASARGIEVVSVRAIAGTGRGVARLAKPSLGGRGVRRKAGASGFIARSELEVGGVIDGPVIIQDPFSTFFLKRGWRAELAFNGALLVRTGGEDEGGGNELSDAQESSEVRRELFRHRFENTVAEMGVMLQRSAISTNVKERADFSCALLSAEGELIANAPHIPVHLGALGLCVRKVMASLPLQLGDTVITNHPGFGGSHLPDVTLITPVFAAASTKPIAFVANRAHHAEIGGITPGSMPPNARSLAEEGVVIDPCYLIRGGRSQFHQLEEILTGATLPTRHLADNLADLNAQLAANLRGVELVQAMVVHHGAEELGKRLEALSAQCAEVLAGHLARTGFVRGSAVQRLDDGTEICANIFAADDGRLVFDFAGTSAQHSGNLNASPAIVRSAVLYVLQLWTQSSLPLNEGMLRAVDIRLPRCFLNPEFPDDANQCPAVVGGNVETSQRLVDTFIQALGMQACSQGTMNNLIFGDAGFGYYETIGGGAGAGEGYDGASGLHTHMTNTAITDPEILECRYPVRLRTFALRRDSGGRGKWQGGEGLVREFEFLSSLQVSLLTQHRKEEPYGVAGGQNGAIGGQWLSDKRLPGNVWIEVEAGDVLRIETPGGGGWGCEDEG